MKCWSFVYKNKQTNKQINKQTNEQTNKQSKTVYQLIISWTAVIHQLINWYSLVYQLLLPSWLTVDLSANYWMVNTQRNKQKTIKKQTIIYYLICISLLVDELLIIHWFTVVHQTNKHLFLYGIQMIICWSIVGHDLINCWSSVY